MFWENDRLSSQAASALLIALKLTLHQEVEPDHFLIALLDDPKSALSKACARLRPGLDTAALRDTLVNAVRRSAGLPFTGEWADGLLSKRSLDMLAALRNSAGWQEHLLDMQHCLLAATALESSKPRIRNLFTHAGVGGEELLADLRRPAIARPPRPVVFADNGTVLPQAFDRPAQKVLNLIESEGKGLGLSHVGTPLLLFALASRENGVLETALRLQVIDPRQLHQNLLVHLRGLGKARFNDQFSLTRPIMQTAIVETLERAAGLAHERDLTAIGEVELVQALLQQHDLFVEPFLSSLKVDLKELQKSLLQPRAAEPTLQEDNPVLSLTEIEKRLRSKVVGQDHVIDAVMPILKRFRFGYGRPGRPMGVLLFLGMSGTGKTQLAKEIAQAIYGSEDQLIFLEMGQFGDQHSKTIFIGAPPGYVGYGEGLLTNGLRNKPESVVLFDEVEKAHRSVFDVVLRFLDEGQIADPAGPVRDGQRCIIILTSNHALDVLRPVIEQQSRVKRLSAAEREAIRAEVRQAILQTDFFRPEFINRVDDILLFNTFDEAAYRQILQNQLQEVKRRFQKEKDLTVTLDDDVVEALVGQCTLRADEGARVCGKLVSNLVVGQLIDFFTQDGNEHAQGARLRRTARGDIEVVAG